MTDPPPAAAREPRLDPARLRATLVDFALAVRRLWRRLEQAGAIPWRDAHPGSAAADAS